MSHKPKRKKILPIVDARVVADNTLLEIREACAKQGTPVSCPTGPEAIGCNACCRGAVLVVDVELNQIKRAMDRHAWDRVRQLAGDIDANDRQAVCPLLDPDTGACTVYDVRPLACRLYAVVSPVDDCYPERVGTKEVAVPEDCAQSVDLIAAWVIGTEDPRRVLQHITTLGPALVREMRAKDKKKAAKRRRKGK